MNAISETAPALRPVRLKGRVLVRAVDQVLIEINSRRAWLPMDVIHIESLPRGEAALTLPRVIAEAWKFA